MKEEGTIFKPGRLVNAATLGKNKHSLEERRRVNAARPIKNKYVEAARNNQGYFIILDPEALGL